ncbi:hypothetical protein FQB35_13865 [Crassaminicella thermophila]|uniref:arginine--tRNA ligase n=1 Tax=Crassaminicella thermophila TaxID=2599308 RepID=A0A5C0SJZ9_CRATE|nr:DALR anticodon-binding domain-containing protein [Crassaminicella thermophila]QEK13269.1 hypothetical protein FQB35_13865 [Crassaminicella thermophila]
MQKIKKIIQEVLKDHFEYEIAIEDIQVEEPKVDVHGDYTTNIALKTSKILKKHPMDLAEQIVNQINKKYDIFERIDIANPGFINFFLKSYIFYELLDFKEYENLNKIHLKQLCKEYTLKEELDTYIIRSAQYVHSRIYSIIKIFEEEGVSIKNIPINISDYEISPFEKMMIRKILAYPKVLKSENPNEIVQYMIKLCELFYKFQEKILFRKLDKRKLYVTLKIINGIRIVIKDILDIFNIHAPTKM